MAQSNHERVGRALELLNTGLSPFVERYMQATYGAKWLEQVKGSLLDHQLAALRRKDSASAMDTQLLLIIMWDYWQPVFKNVLGRSEQTLVSELREIRNRWAHQEAFSTDDAYRALDSVQRLLKAVSAGPLASEVERQKHEVMRVKYENQTRQETQKMNTAPLEGKPMGGLPSWRNVVTPHPDVTTGRYLDAEFAADLGQVHRGEGSIEYREPREFFQRTYITHGLHQLLVRSLQRLSGEGGEPVIDLQTNFGGGKTHSLLALYHLFSGAPLSDLAEVEPLLKEAGVSHPFATQRVVLVGHELSPGQTRKTPDGCEIHTLWGELAWQLLRKDGYAMVAESDRQGVNPGTVILRELFEAAALCLILIDELALYIRQLYYNSNLPAGSFDANLSFIQSLTEAAKTPKTQLVVTIPAPESAKEKAARAEAGSDLSGIEAGGEGGKEATIRLQHIFARIQSPWRPAVASSRTSPTTKRVMRSRAPSALFMTSIPRTSPPNVASAAMKSASKRPTPSTLSYLIASTTTGPASRNSSVPVACCV